MSVGHANETNDEYCRVSIERREGQYPCKKPEEGPVLYCGEDCAIIMQHDEDDLCLALLLAFEAI